MPTLGRPSARHASSLRRLRPLLLLPVIAALALNWPATPTPTPTPTAAAAAAAAAAATARPEQPRTGDAAGATIVLTPARVGLRPIREFNGDGRTLDLVLDVERPVPVPAEPGEPATIDEVRTRLQPNVRERRRAAERLRESVAEQLASRPLPEIRLALVAADGRILQQSGAIEPGPFDLSIVMPSVWNLRQVAWLQPFTDAGPTGTPLVVQPMLGRQVPVPKEAVSPSGLRYTRITGWAGEDEAWDAMSAALRGRPWPPPSDEPPVTGEEASGDEDADGSDAGDEPAGTSADPPSGTPRPSGPPAATDRVFTGFRIYADALVSLDTEYGEIVIELRPDAAPNTAWNFRRLVDGGFYRQTVFHRIVPLTPAGDPFVIQGGDPSGGGSGGPGWWLPMERSPLRHDFGVVSMARDVHPDSAGSQFFICLSRAGTARLDGSYTAFGQVVAGADVVRRIALVPLADAATGRPREAPLVREARLIPARPRSLDATSRTTPGDRVPSGRVPR